MSEYTPSTGEVRRRYAYARSAGNKNQSAVAEFDRWLAAHDAEVRASLVTEEPEGEVEYRVFDREGELWAGSSTLEEAMHYLAQDPTGCARIERAVWTPVQQGGDDA